MKRKKQKAIEEERSGISEQFARVRAEETRYFDIYSNIMDLARRAGEIYAKRTPEQRRQLLSLLFSNLTLKDKKIMYSFTKPVEVMAKRIQTKLDVAKKFEPEKTLTPQGRKGSLVPELNSMLRG